jgi:hypothetical protein
MIHKHPKDSSREVEVEVGRKILQIVSGFYVQEQRHSKAR